MITLEEDIQNYLPIVEKWISVCNQSPDELKHSGLKIRFLHEALAVKAIKDCEYDKAKHHFFTAALLDEVAISKFNDHQLSYGLGLMAFPLLSDNEGLIQRYSKLRYLPWGKMKGMEENVQKGKSDIWANTIQYFMANDKEGIERNLNIIETITIKQVKSKPLINDYEFFKALYNENKSKMEEVLEVLLSPKEHKKRCFNDIYAKYISTLALGYAKLAWRIGIEVEVNSHLVPKELLPIRPLDFYEIPYEFLK